MIGATTYKLVIFLVPFFLDVTQNDFTVKVFLFFITFIDQILTQHINQGMASLDVNYLLTNTALDITTDVCINTF